MSVKQPRFKTVFATQLHAIVPTEETRNEVKASLSQLHKLLPANIDPADEPALLFVAGNMAVAGLTNKNDDGYDRETALVTYKKFLYQQINAQHDREKLVGFIVHAGLSEYGTDRLLTEDEARASGKPFNVAVVIALWRINNPALCDYIESASSPTHPDFNSLSLSFEMAFDGYYIASIPATTDVLDAATVKIKQDDSSFKQYDEALRANSGTGIDPNNAANRIYRVIDEGVIPLGGGIVTRPAASVQGLTAITQKPVEQPAQTATDEAEARQIEEAKRAQEIELAIQEARNTAYAAIEHIEKNFIAPLNSLKTRVSPITSTNSHMNLTEIKSATDAAKVTLASAKPEALSQVVASILDPITKAIADESVRQETERKERESHSAKIAEAKAAAEAVAQEMTVKVAELTKELDAIKQARAAEAAEEAFNNRMKALDEVFDLDQEERALLVDEVKAVTTDEAFAAFVDKKKKLMKEKTKDFKKKKADEAKAAQDALVAKLGEKNVKASFNGDEFVVNEVIASAKETPTSTAAGSIVQPVNSGDLKELAKVAMGGMSFVNIKKKDETK